MAEEWVCPKCGRVMPNSVALCSGSFRDEDHPANVHPRLREDQTWPAGVSAASPSSQARKDD